MQQRIRIRLKSYDHATLDQSAGQIVETVRRTGARRPARCHCRPRNDLHRPPRPHVDKKSREQFEIRVHKRLIDITRATGQTIEALEKLDIPAGVDIEIKAFGKEHAK